MVSGARHRPDGTPAWRVALGGGVVELALSGDRLLLAGGAGRLDALLAGAGGWTAPTREAGEAMASGAAAAAIDFAALVRSLRAKRERPVVLGEVVRR